MHNESFLKCSCRHCGGHIEFPREGLGQTIACPHCHREFQLAAKNTRRRPAPFVLVALILLALGGALAAGIFAARKKPPSTVTVSQTAPVVEDAAPSFQIKSKRRKKAAKPATQPLESPAPAKSDWPGFKVGEVTVEKSAGRLMYAFGSIQNETDRQRFGVRIELNFFDAKNFQVGGGSDYTSVIEPRGEWRFKALVTDTNAIRAEVFHLSEK